MKFKLTAKLLFPLAGLIIIGLIAFTATAYVSARKGLEKTINREISLLSQSMSSKITDWILKPGPRWILSPCALDTWMLSATGRPPAPR